MWNLVYFSYSHFSMNLFVTAALDSQSRTLREHVECCIWMNGWMDGWMVNECLDAIVVVLDDWLSRWALMDVWM